MRKIILDANCDSELLINSLKTFGNTKLDFVDCILYEYSKLHKYNILTFDKDLIKLIRSNP